METPETVSYSTNSAFHALGLPDADDLLLRSDLMRQIVRIIAERKLTQVRAGLLRALSDLGQDMEVRIRPSSGAKGTLRLAA